MSRSGNKLHNLDCTVYQVLRTVYCTLRIFICKYIHLLCWAFFFSSVPLPDGCRHYTHFLVICRVHGIYVSFCACPSRISDGAPIKNQASWLFILFHQAEWQGSNLWFASWGQYWVLSIVNKKLPDNVITTVWTCLTR